jgi:2-polyprenyl-3-methyl-5-hydroxy-6-metoxy-1,4-benzoquinol methylase
VNLQDLRATAQHWEKQGSWQPGRGQFWLELEAVQERSNRKVSCDAGKNWIVYTLERHFAGRLPLQQCLSLGCGEGGLERELASLGAFVHCDACDIAEGSIQNARQTAKTAGFHNIDYAVAELNSIELCAERYDAVWAMDSVHHVKNLEHLFAQAASALKPNGLLILNEYVGPTRFQFAARQRQIIQACNDLLPPDYRRIVTARLQQETSLIRETGRKSFARRLVAKVLDGDLVPALRRRLERSGARRAGVRPTRTSVHLPVANSVAAVDPSEAVRSADIMPVLRQHFDIVEYKPLGGAILQFLLADIAGNFETKDGERLLPMLFGIEDVLMEIGDLPSDFAYIVARPQMRQTSVPSAETWKALHDHNTP